MNRLLLPTLACAVLLLNACAAQPPERETWAERDIGQVMDEARAAATRPEPPSAVTEALIPPEHTARADLPARVEQRFDLNVENQPATAFFAGLVRGTRYNMVVHPDVAGTISLSLKNVTIPEVMEITRDAYGYEYTQSPGGFMVLPAQVRSRVFEINYLNVKRIGSSRVRVSSGQATDGPGGGIQPGLGGVGQVGGFGGQGGGQALSGSSVETDSEADFWPLLQETLESMVGTGQGRGVIINPQTGTLVVRGMPAELREVEQYLAMVQSSSQRMVILEAKIIEVELRDGFESGINWRAIRETSANRQLTADIARGRESFSADNPLAGRETRLPIPGMEADGFGGLFGFGLVTNDFAAFIELLETQGRTQVLSSPRTTAINNQKAVIKVGSDEFFVTNIGSQTAIGSVAAAATASNIQLTPFFSGISLDVTPQISGNGDVILHIQPTVSEVRDQTKVLPVSPGQQSVPVPLAFSSVRQSDSIVRARSGQVIVIGGLMRSETRSSAENLPVLGRVPVAGALFRQSRQHQVTSELVILLRPVVIDDTTWAEQIREHDERLRARSGAGQR